jgi:hypothetical protein
VIWILDILGFLILNRILTLNIGLGKNDELTISQGIPIVTDLKRKVIEKGLTIEKKIDFPLLDGIHTYCYFGKPFLNDEGEIIGACTTLIDMTELDR